MTFETREGNEAAPTLSERLQGVYDDFLNKLSETSSFDDLKHVESNTMEALGALQKEAEEKGEELSVTFRNGYDFDEIRSGIGLYKSALLDYMSIDENLTENSKAKKTEALEAVQDAIPDDVKEQVKRIVDESEERQNAYWEDQDNAA